MFMPDTKFCYVTIIQRGLTVTVDGEEHTFRGTIVMVPGDNLASQYLGGYKALNAALRKCRHCLAVGEDMKTKVRVATRTLYM